MFVQKDQFQNKKASSGHSLGVLWRPLKALLFDYQPSVSFRIKP
jgi:hypothetical protein